MSEGLEIVYGKTGNFALEHELADYLRKCSTKGTMYIGYPAFASEEGHLQFDILLSSLNSGLVIFDTQHFKGDINSQLDSIRLRQNLLYNVLTARMRENSNLCNGRRLKAEPLVVSLHEIHSDKLSDNTIISTFENINNYLSSTAQISDDTYYSLNAFILNTQALRSKKKRNRVKNSNSLGSKIKFIERTAANLDSYQKSAALELFDGPQKIRGIAGSGKTIVLAIKTANLHLKFPEWRILLTYNTKSQKKQFEHLVRAFSSKEPDWSKVTILPTWGNFFSSGVYNEICERLNHPFVNFSGSNTELGSGLTFKDACAELLKLENFPEIFDVALIDEAQDLPQEFFELIYHTTKNPKRIVYAYDELQNLNRLEMKPTEQLFGKDESYQPRISFKEEANHTKQDFVLPICYRNPPWILTTALGLGLGIHRGGQILQMFNDRRNWNELGFESVVGEINYGDNVQLMRNKCKSPHYFEKLFDRKTSIQFKTFDSKENERLHVYKDIIQNLEENEIEPDDILVIVANPNIVMEEFHEFSKLFIENPVGVHAAGVVSRYESIFEHNSIAVTNMHCAKGHEAAVVYIVGAEYCASIFDAHIRRNLLYSCITRTKCWVRVNGVGDQMQGLENEFNRIQSDDFSLKFTYPTKSTLQQIRTFTSENIVS